MMNTFQLRMFLAWPAVFLLGNIALTMADTLPATAVDGTVGVVDAPSDSGTKPIDATAVDTTAEAKELKKPADLKAMTAESEKAIAAFQKVSRQLRTVTIELSTLQLKYFRTKDLKRRKEIERRWKELIAQGEKLEIPLIQEAMKGYRVLLAERLAREEIEGRKAKGQEPDETPKDVKQQAREAIEIHLYDLLMVELRQTTAKAEKDGKARAKAYELARFMMDSGCDQEAFFDTAGIAAFRYRDFSMAFRCLVRANKSNHISVDGEAILQRLTAADNSEDKKLLKLWYAGKNLTPEQEQGLQPIDASTEGDTKNQPETEDATTGSRTNSAVNP